MDQKAAAFHELLMAEVNKAFPITKHKIRSTDDPWIDEATKKAIKRRKDVFYEEQRSDNWKNVKSLTDGMVARRKKKYYQAEAEKLAQEGSHTTPYKALKNICEKERAPTWTVRSIRTSVSAEEQAEELADYFAAISQEFLPLNMKAIPKPDKQRTVNDVTTTDVASRIVHMRKPKSCVSIDPPPRFVNMIATETAQALTPIINAVRRGEGWPKIWKTEEVSVIPKTGWPEDYRQCRNVSCTSIYAKLCETYLLDQLYEEVPPEICQFGGLRGRSAEHLLAEMITEIMENLDDNRAAVNIISVDLSKAFNRVNHMECLGKLAECGASRTTISMTTNFLADREMRIKMGNGVFSTSRKMPGGAPQGTKTGNFLFCTATRDLEHEQTNARDPSEEEQEQEDLFYTPPTSPTDTAPMMSPLGGYSRDIRLKAKACMADTSSEESTDIDALRISQRSTHEPPPRWQEKPVKQVKFVDDLTAIEKIDIVVSSHSPGVR